MTNFYSILSKLDNYAKQLTNFCISLPIFSFNYFATAAKSIQQNFTCLLCIHIYASVRKFTQFFSKYHIIRDHSANVRILEEVFLSLRIVSLTFKFNYILKFVIK